jgi:RNA polymerase sigma-70 factor (ECF subfamily)
MTARHELSPIGGPAPSARAPAELEAVFRASFGALVRTLSLVSDEAPDVVQEAFLEAHRNWATVSGYDDPAGWIRHVAINKARDRIRRRSTERRLLSRIRPPLSREQRPEEVIDLRAAVRRLPSRQQLAIALYYVADLPVDEVAATMSVTSGAVKASLHAGRKRLAQILEVQEVREVQDDG